MKIAIFSAQYLPNYGGVERYTRQLALRAQSAGHEVCIVTSEVENLPPKETTPEGIRIYRLPVWQLMGGRFPVLKPNALFQTIATLVWSEEFDVCVVQARFYILSLFALRQAKRRGIPAVLIDHSSGHLQPDGKLATLVGHWYEHLSAGWIRRNCKRIYGVSECSCNWLTHMGLSSAGIFYNSVDVGEIDKAILRQSAVYWRAKLGLEQNDLLVLFSGRLIPEKGISKLMEAMRLLKNCRAHLIIAGDGPLLAQIKTEECGKVRVLGNLPHDEMIGLFSQADIYCLPSQSEGFATTLLEAAACGCPIIMTETGGASELIRSEAYGVLLKDTEPDTIAAALEKALADEKWRRIAGALLRSRVEENYDWDVTARRVLDTLESLVKTR